MKSIKFTKMAGAGNDFVIIEAQAKSVNLKKLSIQACDRSNGIGADGLIILDKSKKADFKMRIINADGTEAEMCGNGARCVAAYIVANKKTKKKNFSIETIAGILNAEAKGEVATVTLSEPKDLREDIPLTISGQEVTVSYVDTGVPHAVIFVHSVDHIDVHHIGRDIRNHKEFAPRGANVNFVEQLKSNRVDVRTFERGVEGETKACGTGSVASGLITFLKANPKISTKKNASMQVKTKSGEVLKVTFDLNKRAISNVRLNGSAKFIAKGEYYV